METSLAAQVLADPDSYSEQDVYHAVTQSTHNVGAWVQILDEDERPMWEIDTITDGGVSFDISQTPDRTLGVTVLDIGGRLLSGAPIEEAAEARRFVRAIYAKQTPKGWFRFPMFTGPMSSGGLRRQGAEVSISCQGKESLYIDPFVTWTAQVFPKHTKLVEVIHDIAHAHGERRFRLPNPDRKLAKRMVVPRFSEPWKYIKIAASKLGMVPYFDGEGYLSLRQKRPKTVAYTFDPAVVLTPPELADDYTTLINAAVTAGPNPDGPVKALHVPAQLPPANPFSPQRMARHDIPRRAVATDDLNWDWHIPKVDGKELTGKARDRYLLQFEAKKRDDLKAHSESMLSLPQKTVSFDALPVPHLRPGMLCRILGEYEEQQVDEKFLLRSGFFPLTADSPMTVGTWKPIAANWKAIHNRARGSR